LGRLGPPVLLVVDVVVTAIAGALVGDAEFQRFEV
jgi:hypothetical protein